MNNPLHRELPKNSLSENIIMNSIIVQSNTLCLLQRSCNADSELVFVQNRERQSDIATRERIVYPPETQIYGLWRDFRLEGNLPPKYI